MVTRFIVFDPTVHVQGKPFFVPLHIINKIFPKQGKVKEIEETL